MLENKQMEFPLSLDDVAEDGTFTGYASVFDVTDNHNDVVVKGAFNRTLNENNNVKLLWQHRMDEPIGVISHLSEDARGLYIEGKLLLDVGRGKEAYSLLKSGAINGLSIGYSVVDYDVDGHSGTRLLKDINLWEVSLVTFPANELAGVTTIKSANSLDTVRKFENFLREAGFSRSESKHIALSGFQREAEQNDELAVLEMAIDKAAGALG